MLSRIVHSGQKRQKSILVIENNAVIQELLRYCLNLSNCQCSMVDAIHITSFTWTENSVYPLSDAIILDADIYSKDVENPLDFMHAFCERWKSIFMPIEMPPLLLLTTRSVLSEKLQRAGYTVVMKPFKLPVFLDGLETAMRREREGGTIKVEVVDPVFA